MFIERGKSGYNRDGEQYAQGRFLVLMTTDSEPLSKVKAIVRHVHMGQCGNFMMGRINIKAGGVVHKLVLSGSYGGDGLTKSVPKEVYDLGVDLPAELYEAWSKGEGWNSAGKEAPQMREWAKVTFAPKVKAQRPLYPQGKLSSNQNYAWYARFKGEMTSIVNHHIRHMTTHEEFSKQLVQRVYMHPVWKKLHKASASALMGYIDAARDIIYAHHLEWRMWCDGSLQTKAEINALDKVSPGAWSRIDGDKSRHVWAKDSTKLY